MPLGDFVEVGTIPKPLPIGRTGRLIAGAGAHRSKRIADR